MNYLKSFVAAVWNRIASEPAAFFAGVVAVINTATDQTLKGYLLAVALFCFRWAVSPALPKV